VPCLTPANKRILHVIPDTVLQPRHAYLGSTKVVRCLTSYFLERGLPFDEVVVPGRSDAALLSKLRETQLDSYDAIVIEYPVYPRSMRFIRNKYPQAKLIVRSHNAEFYHWMDYAKSVLRQLKVLKAFKYSLTSFKRLWLDYVCARYSDYVLSITPWEKEHYWTRLSRHSRIVNVPYYVTDSFVDSAEAVREKENLCVCMMSTVPGPLLYDAAKNLSKLVSALNGDCGQWKFTGTGDTSSWPITLPSRITMTGFLDNPLGILAKSRALALLSDYGYGFKTKILDAILCRAYVLVTKRLYDRLPEEVRPFCITVDMNSVDSFKDALSKCLLPYPEGNPNEDLKNEAFSALDSVLYG